jgi:peptidyl-prolyl cis-trans isomerase SurA
MKKNRIIIKGIIFLLSLVVIGNHINGQNSLDKKTLVTIGEEEISVGEFMQVYNKNNTQSTLQEPSTIEEYLDLFINFKLKVREAVDLQMDTIIAFQEELAGYRDQLAKPYFVDESVNDDLLKEAYNRKLYDIRASHILLMVNENARPEDTLAAYNEIAKIREEIMAGKDFAEAAIEYSDDPSARDREEIPGKQRFRKGNQGDLGYFTVFNMVYPFENAA